MSTCFYAAVAGITFRFESAFPMEVPAEFRPFPFPGGEVQEVFSISPISKPVSFPQSPVFTSTRLNVYRTDDGIAREFTAIHDADGCKAVCVLRENGKNSLLFPEKLLDRLQMNCTLSLLLVIKGRTYLREHEQKPLKILHFTAWTHGFLTKIKEKLP